MDRRVVPRILLCVLALAVSGLHVSPASADRGTLHLEVDPTPFILGGYGVQPGFAPAQLPGWRFGLGNFSLDVPDFVAQLNDDNDGFHIRVRRSHALYVLHFFSDLRGWCVGGSLRYLRTEYTHDDVPGLSARASEFSIEAIGGYKWHPFPRVGFYVMPWLAIARGLFTIGDQQVGDRRYQPDFVQFFATANIGWEFGL